MLVLKEPGHAGSSPLKVLRAGGPYLASQQGRHLVNLLCIIVAGGTGAVVAGFLLHPILGLVCALASAAPARRQYAKLSSYRKGIAGEELVSTLLARLSDDFCLVNDVKVRGHRGNIDHVLIGPCGVVAIETKNYQGLVTCDRNEWFKNGRRIRNISRQARGGARALRDWLKDTFPAFRPFLLDHVEDVVVYTHPLCRLEINRPGSTIVRYSELLNVISVKAERRVLDPSQSLRIGDALARRAKGS